MQHGIVSLDALLGAIKDTYASSRPCHCLGQGNLSERELLISLCDRRVLPESARPKMTEDDDRNRLYEQVGEDVGRRLWWALGIRRAEQIGQFSMNDLMRLPSVGYKKAREMELTLARRGFYLADGNRGKLALDIAATDAPAAAAPETPEAETPEAVRRWAADTLHDMGTRFMKDGAALVEQARKLDRGKGRVIGALRRYIAQQITGWQAIQAIIQPVAAMEDAMKAIEKAESAAALERDRAERLGQNVVTFERAVG